jgi:prepilin-type N-terminal cleavage/methylation domain-containing protein
MLGVTDVMRKPTRGNGRGFTLLEALISIVIFGVGLSTFFGLFPYSLHEVRHSNIYLQAVSEGQQYMDAVRSSVEQSRPIPGPTTAPIDGGFEVLGNGARNLSPGNFTVTGSCVLVSPFTRLKHCTVNVQWTEDGFNRSYGVESYATQQIS